MISAVPPENSTGGTAGAEDLWGERKSGAERKGGIEMNRRKSGSVGAWGLCALAVWVALCAPAWAYKQDYLYEDRGSWRNVQMATDWNGKTYFTLYDSEGATSLIYQVPEAFSGRREDLEKIEGEPFMTIPGRAGIEITNDEAASYVYYTLDGDKTNLYRRSLKRGDSGQPEVRDFTLEGSPFVFRGFALAKEPDQILLVSRENARREVTIGLFSFSNWSASGANEPIRTWTCTLPEDRKYKPLIDGEVGYSVVYEASTDRVWLVVQQSYFGGGQVNCGKYFFYAPLEQGGALRAFDPETEVPGWNDDAKFKRFSVYRYRRLVHFTDSETPNLDYSSIAVYEAGKGGRMRSIGRVDSWMDSGGRRRPLREFWGGSKNSVFRKGTSTDSDHNLYARYRTSDSHGNEDFVRIARFAPEQPIHQDGAPDPAKDGRKQPTNAIVLDALPFKGPEGYLATGSRWEVYRKTDGIKGTSGASSIRSYEGQEPVYEGRNTDGSPSHKLTKTLPAGDYVWRMAYNWLIEGEGGMTGSTRWSKLGSFTAVESSAPTPKPEPQPSPDPKPTPNPTPRTDKNKGGGGCDVGLSGTAGLLLLLAASLFLRRR